jgi:hypothetical protein
MPFGYAAAAVGAMVVGSALAPDAPDMSGANAAAVSQADLSAEQLAWAKEMYADSAPQRADSIARANEISDAQLLAMNKQIALTDDYANYNKQTFRPLEQGIVADAQDYDTTQRRDSASAAAISSVGQQADIARQSQNRNMQRMGVNPSSGKMMAMQNQTGIQEAAAKAGAGTAARNNVETQGYARTMDAANLGRNLASNQATSAGIAVNQGNASAANSASTGNITAGGNSIMNSGYAGAQSGLAGASSSYLGIAGVQQKADATKAAAMGSAGEAAGGAYASYLKYSSDVNLKENIEPVDPAQALASVTQTPVSNWAYKEGIKASDGGQTHTGPMAQDVNKTMGEGAAPGGKKIDLISMNGMTMAAIQGLNKKVDKIMAMQGMPA